jgi:putative ABC transport system permease protein
MKHRKRMMKDLEQDIRDHIERETQDNIERGMSPEEAHYAAMRKFGNVTRVQEETREVWIVVWLEQLLQDVCYGLRMLAKSPGFTAIAILTLALGIGANTAIFSLIDTAMLRLLPVQKAEELVQVGMLTPNFGSGSRTSYTNPLWEALRDNQDVFAGVFAWGEANFNLAQGGVVQNARGIFTSGDYFATLGVQPAAGRLLTVNDDKRGCPGVAVLSYGFWQEHFGGAPDAVGSTIPIDGHPFQVIGVSAASFFGTEVGRSFDVAAPICAEAIVDGQNSSLDQRSSWWFRVMGRLKPGQTLDQASVRLATLSPQIFAATVPTNWNPVQQRSFLTWKLVTLPGATGLSFLRGDYNLPLKMLMAIAGLVLLIACANIASLMLARAASRRKEIAVRLALGASRIRLVRQLLTECVILSLAGATLGIFVARWSSRLLVSYISTEHNRVYLDLTLDARILAFTAGVSILTGLLFGVLPAFRSTRVSLAGSMKGVVAEIPGTDTRFRSGRWTVAAQVAISLVLVVTAGLFVRSFANLATLDAGFDRNNVLIVDLDMHDANLQNAERIAAVDEIMRRVRALPGVVSASQSVVTPVSGNTWDDLIVVEGSHAPTGNDADVDLNHISPGYFSTMRTPLLEGRDFNESDVGGVPRVVIVNQALARKFFPGVDPLGKTIRRFATATTLSEPIEIVGVARDAKYESLREDFPPVAYFPLAELPGGIERSHVLIRTVMRPSLLAPSVEQAIASVNKSVALRFHTLAQQVNDSIVQERLLATLSGFFGGLALLLAIIGFYGVLAYLVLQRQKEIGIRIALGAQRGAILRLVMRDAGLLLTSGVAAGAGLAWLTTRYVQSLLFGLRAHDPATIALGIGLLVAVAFLASYLPVRRAMRIDPMVALRYE